MPKSDRFSGHEVLHMASVMTAIFQEHILHHPLVQPHLALRAREASKKKPRKADPSRGLSSGWQAGAIPPPARRLC